MSTQKTDRKHGNTAAAFTGPVWLVKSGERILGPFSADDISRQLRVKDVTVIDEVIRPGARWRLIRDEPVFYRIVEEVHRLQMNAREDTEIQNSQSGFTATATDLLTSVPAMLHPRDEQSAQRFQRDSDFVSSETSSGNHFSSGEIQDADFTESSSRGSEKRDSTSSNFRKFGMTGSGSPVPRSLGISAIAWLAAAVVVGGVIVYLLRGQNSDSVDTATRGRNIDRLLSEANLAWDKGEFPHALSLYKSADRVRGHDPFIVSRMAPLLVHIELQTATAKRELLDTIETLPSETSTAERSQLLVGLGLAALASDDLSEAETRFRAAINLAGSQPSARFDYAMAAFKERQFSEAAKRFSAVPESPPALIMLALSLLASDRDSRSPNRQRAEAAIKKVLATSQDFLQEAYLVGAVLALEGGESRVALSRVKAGLDTDPDLTTHHWHDPFLYLDALSWREFIPLCQSLNDELKSGLAKGFLALCLFKAGEHDKARVTIDEALVTAPDGQYLRAINSYMLMNEERYEDARASLKLASTKTEQPRLWQLMNARLCLHSVDTSCAEKGFTKLASDSPPMLSAMTALSAIYKSQGDQERSRYWFEKAATTAPSYIEVLTERQPANASLKK